MRRSLLIVAIIGIIATGCSLQPDAAPRDLGGDELVLGAGGASGESAAGADRIFLVGPDGEQLRSVARDADGVAALLDSLFLGPNPDELEQQLFSNIPADTEVLDTRVFGGVVQIDTTAELSSLSGGALTRALAQIVYTATSIDSITAIEILVDGREVAWPTATGETSTGALRVYDFPNAAESSQPDYPALPVGG